MAAPIDPVRFAVRDRLAVAPPASQAMSHTELHPRPSQRSHPVGHRIRAAGPCAQIHLQRALHGTVDHAQASRRDGLCQQCDGAALQHGGFVIVKPGKGAFYATLLRELLRQARLTHLMFLARPPRPACKHPCAKRMTEATTAYCPKAAPRAAFRPSRRQLWRCCMPKAPASAGPQPARGCWSPCPFIRADKLPSCPFSFAAPNL